MTENTTKNFDDKLTFCGKYFDSWKHINNNNNK